MCHKAIDRCFFVFDSIPDQYKTPEMCDRVVSKDPSLIIYCPDKYKTQRMWDEAVDDSLTVLKFIPDWFDTRKMIKKLLTLLCAGGNVICCNEDSDDVIFSYNEMGILDLDLSNINLDDSNYNEDDPDTSIHVRLLAWCNKSLEKKDK